ncbi:MAG: MazG nucleotide pyrophosphohydrolase domain-containing protein, partial [Clostridia bacterium]
MLTVVGMGRADGDVTLSGLRAIESADRVIIKSRSTFMTKFMQNRKIAFCDLDEIYQQAENFDELNTLIVDKLVAMSGEFGKVVFCVTGSGSDDTTVARLIDSGIDFEMVSGVGFEESVLTIASPTCYQTFTATQLLEGGITSACATVVKYIDDFMVAGQVKLALLNVFDFDTPVKFYDGKTIKDILLVDLDRQKYNYRATILIEPKNFRNKSIFTFEDVVKIIKILRAPGGCPWDSAQTHESIKANAIEEAYELSNAIEKQDLSNMVEELGDAILVTILHIAIGEGEGEFCLADVLSAL